MQRITITLIMFLCLLCLSCSNSKVQKPESYSVSGSVHQYNLLGTAHAVLIAANGDTAAKTLCAGNGKFKLENLPAGEFTLSLFVKNTNESFAQFDSLLSISSNVNVGGIDFPAAITLNNPHEITNGTVAFRWSQFSSSNFESYDIYRVTFGDELNFNLMHSTPFVYDTTYRDNGLNISTLQKDTDYGYVVKTKAGNFSSQSNMVVARLNDWQNESNFTVFYELEKYTTYKAPYDIHGLAYDGRYFWILAFQSRGGYYDNNRFILVKYDPLEDVVLKYFEYDDEIGEAFGLAWDGKYVWGYFGMKNEKPHGDEYIKRIDPATGEIVRKIYDVKYGIKDIAWHDNRLYLCAYYPLVEQRHAESWAIEEHFINPLCGGHYGNIGFGIAVRDDEIWLSSIWEYWLAIMNRSGEHIGIIPLEGFIESTHPHLCFVGERLVIADRNNIHIFDITQK